MTGRGEGEKLSWQRQREPPDRNLGPPKAPGTQLQRCGQNGPTENGHVGEEGEAGRPSTGRQQDSRSQ